MPGPVPGIHAGVQPTKLAYFIARLVQHSVEVLLAKLMRRRVDGRDKPGHDGEDQSFFSDWPMICCAVKLMPQVGKALPTKKLSD
jgi:hypothetical protein